MEVFDYLIIGSGFGGSVSAMRLAQKGYKVAIVEEGSRFKDGDYPINRKNLGKILWAPKLGFYGLNRTRPLKDLTILGAAGVGGGSNNYANTLYVPDDSFFNHQLIKKLGGKNELLPFYRIAEKMLGVSENPYETHIDHCIKNVIQEESENYIYKRSSVGVYFGEKGVVKDDPYFLGEGPARKGCEFCGGCMTGCNSNAKNTLEKNYLFFAERFGAKIYPLHKVVGVSYNDDNNNPFYEVSVKVLNNKKEKSEKIFRSVGIVFSAGVIGNLELLLNMKKSKKLDKLSDMLGSSI